jgi:hypothetical protein
MDWLLVVPKKLAFNYFKRLDGTFLPLFIYPSYV